MHPKTEPVQQMKCLYCSKVTTLHNINVQKKINTKVVTIRNAPVYYCKPCDETFLANETLSAFSYIKSGGLENNRILFDFEEINRRITKSK